MRKRQKPTMTRVRRSGGPEVSVDLLSGLALAVVGALFLGYSERQWVEDWMFPIGAASAAMVIGIVLIGRSIWNPGRRVALLPRLGRSGLDMSVFLVVSALYIFLARPVGFWVVSAAYVFVMSLVFAAKRTWRWAGMSAVVSIGVIAVFYVLMVKIFYIPLPRSRWLPFGF